MTVNCPNCLKDFKSAWAVSRHLSQPLTSCLRWVDQLETAAQILQDSHLADQHATPGSSPHYRTSSPVQDFQMDFEVQADSEETAYGQDMNDLAGSFYGDEGGVVGLEICQGRLKSLWAAKPRRNLTSSASGTLRKCIGAARPFGIGLTWIPIQHIGRIIFTIHLRPVRTGSSAAFSCAHH